MIDGTSDRWHVPMERKIDWRQEAIIKIRTAAMCLDDALDAIKKDKNIDSGNINEYILNYRNKLRDLEEEMRG